LEGLSIWGKNLSSHGENMSLTLNDEAVLPIINKYLVEGGADVYLFNPKRLSLEELFLKVVGEGSEA
jgi:hypothetical protein